MNLILIGYRATGKSTLAPLLAKRLGWTAVDADVELERGAGRTIRQIFDDGGEPEFRKLERNTLVDLLAQEQLVIAAGGGAILNEDTRRDFQKAGPVVWLKASVDTIENRLYGDATTRERRPNLTASGGRQEIEDLLNSRDPLYRETASLIVSTDEPLSGQNDPPTIEQLTDLVMAEVGPQLEGSTCP